jgi:hypothetical protein
MTLASENQLHKLAGALYGVSEIDEATAGVLSATSMKVARDHTLDAFDSLKTVMQSLKTPVKVARYKMTPKGLLPEAFNFTKVHKCAAMVELADVLIKVGEYKRAASMLNAHDKIACEAFDWFKEYGSKTAFIQKAKDFFNNQAVRDYSADALKKFGLGAAGTAGVAAVATPVAKHLINSSVDKGVEATGQIMDKAKSTAVNTALGTAGVAVGANQLNNLLNRLTQKSAIDLTDDTIDMPPTAKKDAPDKAPDSQENRAPRPGENTPYAVEKGRGRDGYADKKTDKEKGVHPLQKIAVHFLLDSILLDERAKKQNKIAGVHAIAEFCKMESLLME